VSQLLDQIGNIESKYKAGEKVTAKILKVDFPFLVIEIVDKYLGFC
jgi:ribosomal protein S1